MHETIAQVMPKIYFLIKHSVQDLVKMHHLKAITKEDDVLEKALTKFFDKETRKDVLVTFVRRHLITGTTDIERRSVSSMTSDQAASVNVLERVRQKIFEDTQFKQFCGMRVNIDTDIALKFLELALEPQGAQDDEEEAKLDVRYLLSCQKRRKEEISEAIVHRYKTKMKAI